MVSRPRCSTSVPSISIAFNLRLSDVAEVRRGYEDPPTLLIRHQGEPALALGVVRRQAAREFASPKVRFAMDSPLEGGGFEPSVPGAKEPVSFAEGELRGIERGWPTIVVSLWGTDGSNPSPSSGESRAERRS